MSLINFTSSIDQLPTLKKFIETEKWPKKLSTLMKDVGNAPTDDETKALILTKFYHVLKKKHMEYELPDYAQHLSSIKLNNVALRQLYSSIDPSDAVYMEYQMNYLVDHWQEIDAFQEEANKMLLVGRFLLKEKFTLWRQFDQFFPPDQLQGNPRLQAHADRTKAALLETDLIKCYLAFVDIINSGDSSKVIPIIVKVCELGIENNRVLNFFLEELVRVSQGSNSSRDTGKGSYLPLDLKSLKQFFSKKSNENYLYSTHREFLHRMVELKLVDPDLILECVVAVNRPAGKDFFDRYVHPKTLSDPDYEKHVVRKLVEAKPKVLLRPPEQAFKIFEPLHNKLEGARLVAVKEPTLLLKSLLFLFSENELVEHMDLIDLLRQQFDPAKKGSKYEDLILVQLHLQTLLFGKGVAIAGPSTPASSSTNNNVIYTHSITNGTPESKDSIIWQHIGSKHSSDGKSDIFKLRWEFDDYTTRPNTPREDIYDNKTIISNISRAIISSFPANEHFPFHTLREAMQKPIIKALDIRLKHSKNGTYLIVPDVETLQKNWDRLRTTEEWSYLPEIHIASCLGEASLEEFTRAFYSSTYLQSTRAELIHDLLAHGFSTFILIAADPVGYKTSHDFARKTHSKYQSIIQNAQKSQSTPEEETMKLIIAESIGFLADIITAFNSLDLLQQGLSLWEQNQGFDFWDREFLDHSTTPPTVVLAHRLNREKDIPGIHTRADYYTVARIKEYWIKLKADS